jgi:DNA-binding TFAR19-related protein (PDSD5 family)
MENQLISQMKIDNCNLDDSMLADILHGLSKQKRVVQLFIKRSILGKESEKYLLQLLKKLTPFNLEEFRLENC